jgi:hypothetical protein
LRAVLDDVLETIADSSMRKRGSSWSIESTVSSADTEFSNTARIGSNSAGNADRAIRETSLEKAMVFLFWLAAVKVRSKLWSRSRAHLTISGFLESFESHF